MRACFVRHKILAYVHPVEAWFATYRSTESGARGVLAYELKSFQHWGDHILGKVAEGKALTQAMDSAVAAKVEHANRTLRLHGKSISDISDTEKQMFLFCAMCSAIDQDKVGAISILTSSGKLDLHQRDAEQVPFIQRAATGKTFGAFSLLAGLGALAPKEGAKELQAKLVARCALTAPKLLEVMVAQDRVKLEELVFDGKEVKLDWLAMAGTSEGREGFLFLKGRGILPNVGDFDGIHSMRTSLSNDAGIFMVRQVDASILPEIPETDARTRFSRRESDGTTIIRQGKELQVGPWPDVDTLSQGLCRNGFTDVEIDRMQAKNLYVQYLQVHLLGSLVKIVLLYCKEAKPSANVVSSQPESVPPADAPGSEVPVQARPKVLVSRFLRRPVGA